MKQEEYEKSIEYDKSALKYTTTKEEKYKCNFNLAFSYFNIVLIMNYDVNRKNMGNQ